MIKYYSPLRYPGGKTKLSAFIAKICTDNNINGHYVEPYSGGASIAIFLLLEGFVKKITINDKDRSIYAFWHSVLNKTNELCNLISKTEVTIGEWKRQKLVQLNKENADLLQLGFSTFFLNRTNRSGIINAGVLGGVGQKGEYLINCRYNKTELITRILRIAARKKDVRLYKKDAIKLIDKIEKESSDENVFFYFDPPYYLKASTLYMNHYKEDSHKIVRDRIKRIKTINWVVSYDNVAEIQKLYSNYRRTEYSINHSAHCAKVGKEILFFGPGVKRPNSKHVNPIYFKLDRKSNQIVYKNYRQQKYWQ